MNTVTSVEEEGGRLSLSRGWCLRMIELGSEALMGRSIPQPLPPGCLSLVFSLLPILSFTLHSFDHLSFHPFFRYNVCSSITLFFRINSILSSLSLYSCSRAGGGCGYFQSRETKENTTFILYVTTETKVTPRWLQTRGFFTFGCLLSCFMITNTCG